MPVRAVLLDLDNTLLLEDRATLGAIYRASELAEADTETIATAAASAAAELFRSSPTFAYAEEMGIWWGEALWGTFAGEGPGLRDLRAMVPEFRQAAWTKALAAAGIVNDALASELASAYAAARRSDPALDPAATSTLDAVAQRYRLALVTNGAPDVQREKIATAGIASRFDAVIISAELGIAKPDPRIFEAALDALGVPADEAVMVGDSAERDIAGARGAGLRTVWLDRDGGSEGPVPDRRISELVELAAALAAIEALVTSVRPG